MGLDLVVEGCPKPGLEMEWRQLLERDFSGGELSAPEMARFREISVPGYTRIAAPQVGSDAAADAWIINARKAQTPDEVAKTLKEFAGHFVVRLVDCDGVPAYSNGGLYDGVDETSFRGAFLADCVNVLDKHLRDEAWEHKFPEAAATYGRALLEAARAAEKLPRQDIKSRWRWGRAKDIRPLNEQLNVVRSAGRWYIFWGERGHAIRAYF